MSLKEKIKPLFFALTLFMGVFAITGNIFANEVNYEAHYSSDYGFRVLSMYYDEADNNRIVFEFSLLSTSTKSWNWIEFGSGVNGNPQAQFGTNSASTWGQNMGNSLLFRRWICKNETQSVNPYNGAVAYKLLKGQSIFCSPINADNSQGGTYTNENGLTKSDIETYTSRYLNNPLFLKVLYSGYYDDTGGIMSYYTFIDTTNSGYLALNFGFTSIPPNIDGACGIADNNLPTTIPIPNGEACSAGTVDNMHESYSFNGIIYSWACLGSGEGITVSCETLPYPNPINGVCGSANNTTVYNQPEESEKCSAGASNSTTLITLTGWAWVCEGLYGGTDASCSATYSGGGTPPTIPDTAPIPTPTDCEAYSGIDKIFCNLGNTIEGLFLPTTEKLTELQTTINYVGNVFPFNYLRVIGNTFSNTTITEGSLTMTIWGNTETINPSFWDLEIFEKIKLFSTILILLMFTFWAVGYIKHFF